MRRELKDAETARKLARAIEALQRGEPLARAAAYGSLDRRVVVRFLESVKNWAASVAGTGPGESAPRRARRKPKITKLIAFADGGSRGNPGQSACAVVVFDDKNEELLRRSRRLGVTTNNVAEYHGVLLALELAETLGAGEVEIRIDSELVVRQLNGQYKVKHPSLKPLHARARAQMASFGRVTIYHVPREENELSDGLVNDELDGRER